MHIQLADFCSRQNKNVILTTNSIGLINNKNRAYMCLCVYEYIFDEFKTNIFPCYMMAI